MTTTRHRAARLLPAGVLAVLVLSACSFHGSVSATTSSAHGAAGSAGSTSGVAAAGTSSAGAAGSTSRAASSAPATASSSPGGTLARTDRCHTSELTGSLTPESAGAGQRYATLVLRNTGGQMCTVHGFGGLGLIGSDGDALPTRQVRSGGLASTVLLAPGQSVRSALHWSVVNGPGDPSSGTCQPAPAKLRVIPPDETDAVSVTWSMGPVCSAGTIEQHPYVS